MNLYRMLPLALLSVVSLAQTPAAKPPVYAVSTVKPSKDTSGRIAFMFQPSGLSIENISLESIIMSAYHLEDGQLLNVPAWVKNTHYDIEAKIDEEDREALKKMMLPELMMMVQGLLVERFHLKTHTETRELSVFEIVIAKGGVKMKPTPAQVDMATVHRHGIGFKQHGEMEAQDCPMSVLTNVLAQLSHHLVVDKTGLTGHYDFTLKYSDESTPASAENTAPSLYTALQEQLGLKLETVKTPMPVLVIDSIEQPTPD